MRKFTLFLAFMFFIGMQFLQAQERDITGTVTSSDDSKPIPGVQVLAKGTTTGTVTDLDGKYSITVPTTATILIFRFVGMTTKEIVVGDQKVIDVAMEPDVLNLEGVVVTAMGIKRETKALSYSVQEVGSDEIQKSARTDVINSLQGKVSDVNIISSSGVAGASSYITIRGVQSLTQDNQPLFVVDGVPINNGGGVDQVDGVAFSNRAIDINPDDVESINVLKGGAATALYGLRAASGVIVITTKKGKATQGKKIALNFNSSLTFNKISQTPKLQSIYGQGSGGDWLSGDSRSWGPKLDTCSYFVDPTWPWRAYDVDGQIVGKNDPVANGEAVKTYDQYDFFQTGITTNNSLSLTGGSETTNFYASFSDNQSTGVVPNNKFRRNTFKVAGQTDITKKFQISSTMNYIITGGDRIQQGSNTSGVMLGLLRTPPTFDNSAGYIIENGIPYNLPNGYQRNYRHGGGYDNPYWTVNKNKYNDKVNRIIGNVQADYKPYSWLAFTYRLGVDWWDRKAKDELAIYSRTFPGGWTNEQMELNKDFNSDLIMTIDKDFTKDFNAKFILGNNMSQLYYHSQQVYAKNLVVPDYYNLNNGNSISAIEETQEIRRAGFYGDLTLSWKSMLYITITGRNDWSTTLPQGKNSFFYPSFGAGWIFTQLPGLENNKILPYGKLRISYAIVAKDAVPYSTNTYFGTPNITDGWVSPQGIIWPFMGNVGWSYGTVYINGVAYDQMGNANLKPEKTKTFEVGTDLKFYENRVGLAYTYFSNNGEDLILPVPIASSSGFQTMTMNAASMKTTGHEVTLDVVPIKSKDWEWDITVNFAKIDNKVVALAPGIENLFLGGFEGTDIRAKVGDPYRTFYAYDWVRDASGNVIIDDSGTPATNSHYGYPFMTNDVKPIGNIDPKWTMGAGTNLRWKNLSLYVLFDIKVGGKMWNGTRGALVNFGIAEETVDRTTPYVFDGVYGHYDDAGNLVVSGGTNTTEVLRDQNWDGNGLGSGFIGPGSQYFEKSDWVRLRTLTLSYSLTPLLKKTFIKGLDVFFTGTNLWLSTPYKGIDPETSLLGASNAQGIDYFNMPGTKSFTVGLNMSL